MTISSKEDLAGMTHVGRLVGEAIQEMKAAAKPGMTTAEFDQVGAAFGVEGLDPGTPAGPASCQWGIWGYIIGAFSVDFRGAKTAVGRWSQ